MDGCASRPKGRVGHESTRVSGSDGIAPGIGLIWFVGVEQWPVIGTDSSVTMPYSESSGVGDGIILVGNISVNTGVGNCCGCGCCSCCEIEVALT